MATVDTEICNIALARVRAGEIGNLSEQSVQANKCNIFYPVARRSVLSAFPWTFAKKIQPLTVKNLDLEEWEYCYDYPQDCLKAIYITPPSANSPVSATGITFDNVEYDPIQYEVLTKNGIKVIGSNYENACLGYVYDVEDVQLFDPLFEDMLAWRLAQELAIPLGGDAGKSYRADAMTEYRYMLNEAVAADFNQNQPRLRQQMPSEIKARRGSLSQWWTYNSLFYRR